MRLRFPFESPKCVRAIRRPIKPGSMNANSRWTDSSHLRARCTNRHTDPAGIDRENLMLRTATPLFKTAAAAPRPSRKSENSRLQAEPTHSCLHLETVEPLPDRAAKPPLSCIEDDRGALCEPRCQQAEAVPSFDALAPAQARASFASPLAPTLFFLTVTCIAHAPD
jgi:hypothetical protein